MSVLDALKQAQAQGLPENVLQVLCEACGVPYGAILPPISGHFVINLDRASI